MGAKVVTYLDTHVAVWLYSGRIELLSEAAQQRIEPEDLLRQPCIAFCTYNCHHEE